jgi:hypothetical protein
MDDDERQADTLAHLVRMGQRIAERMAAEHPFPWPGDAMVKVSRDIRQKATEALPHQSSGTIEAVAQATFSAFLDRSLEIARLMSPGI